MQVTIPPDLEALVQKRLESGAYASAEEVVRRALEAQDAEESWTDEERSAIAAHIEEGYQQALRGELIPGDEVRRNLDALQEQWLRNRR